MLHCITLRECSSCFNDTVHKSESFVYTLVYSFLRMCACEDLLGFEDSTIDGFTIVQYSVVYVIDLVCTLSFNVTSKHSSSVGEHRRQDKLSQVARYTPVEFKSKNRSCYV